VCGTCRTRLRTSSWPRCDRCHHPLGTGRADGSACHACRDWPDALTAARHAFVLERPADDLVHALKYEGWRELADFMGRAMAELPLPAHPPRTPSVVIPVPTTARRLAERGYNQAGLLAGRLAAGLGLPLCDALVRRPSARSQTSLKPFERRENVRGAFAPAHAAATPSVVAGAHVLLVDDVLTTGSTAAEAASVLVAMGARTVTLAVFARAFSSRPKRAA
jgi:ComF family protein